MVYQGNLDSQWRIKQHFGSQLALISLRSGFVTAVKPFSQRGLLTVPSVAYHLFTQYLYVSDSHFAVQRAVLPNHHHSSCTAVTGEHTQPGRP
jgi:hypothetical protein